MQINLLTILISSGPTALNPLNGRCAMQTEGNLRKLRNALAFVAATVLVLVAVFYFTQTFLPNTSNELLPLTDKITSKIMTPYWADKRFDKVDPYKDKIMLSKGDAKVIDGIKIVYRGKERRSDFKLDVFVLDFDREMPFPHTLDVKQAKKGFRLSGRDFQLISARKHRVHLWYYKKRQY